VIGAVLAITKQRKKILPVTPTKFEIYRDANNEYRFRLRAANNEIIATGEAYTTKAACMNGIESVKTNAPDAEIEDQTGEG
jgi:uncharacterized protein YegP (UPF0339 family)